MSVGIVDVKLLVEAGNVSASQMGPSLGPTGVNIGQVVKEVDSMTKEFKGMKVPVVLHINKAARPATFTVEIGTPPTSAMIKKAAGCEKGAHQPNIEKVGDLTIQQVLEIVEKKKENMLAKDVKSAAKEVLGTMNSMGVYCEGEKAVYIIQQINEGKFDKELS